MVLSDRVKRNLWCAYLTTIIVWGLNSYALLGEYLRQGEMFAKLMNGKPYVCDFVVFYGAAKLATKYAHTDTNLYDSKLQTDLIREIIAPVEPELPFCLQYPPYFWPFILPLALFDLQTAWFVFCGVGAMAVVAATWWLAAKTFPGNFTRAVVVFSTLCSFPAWLSFRAGQTSVILLPSLILFWTFLGQRRFFFAGLATGLCMLKLQYAPLVIIPGLILGRFKYCGGAALSLLAMCLLAILTIGWEHVARYPYVLLHGELGQTIAGVDAFMMQNLRGELCMFMGGDNPTVKAIAFGGFAIAILAAAALWWRFRKCEGTQFKLLASMTILLSLIASPHAHMQDYLAAALPCVWIWSEIDKHELKGKSENALRILILSFPVISWLFFFLMVAFHLVKIQPFFLWAVVIMVLTACLKPQRVSSETAS